MRRSRIVLALRLRYLSVMGISKIDRSGQFTFEVRTRFLSDPNFEEIIAGAQGISVAIAAFEEQKKHVSEGTAILLCQGGRVVRKWPETVEI